MRPRNQDLDISSIEYPGMTTDQKTYDKEYKAKIRKEFRVKGLCIDCPKSSPKPAIKGTLRCAKCIEQISVNAASWYSRTKLEVITYYGGVCECCGESNIKFLTMDHIDESGAEHRRIDRSAITLYRWLKRHNFPNGFQVLCFNCNCGKSCNGGICPHKENPNTGYLRAIR